MKSYAQPTEVSAVWQRQLTVAHEQMLVGRPDSAMAILQDLSTELAVAGASESDLALQVRVRYAEALDIDGQEVAALDSLLLLRARTEALASWSAYARSTLLLALIYEKKELPAQCLDNLQRAGRAIQRHAIDSLYPKWSVRMGSYHRFYGEFDSLGYYATESVRTGKRYEQPADEADGYFLLSVVAQDSSFEAAMQYIAAAASIYQRTGNTMGHAFTLLNIARKYRARREWERASSYVDSSCQVMERLLTNSAQKSGFFMYAYRTKAEVYEATGRLDSAIVYGNRSHAAQLAMERANSQASILEVEARYADEQKARRIVQQASLLRTERERRWWLTGGIGIVTFFAGFLADRSRRLRQAKQKLEKQATIIQEKNQSLTQSLDKQLVLQSEVHHRVKNNLQVIISLLELQRDDAADPLTYRQLETMADRIYSMAAIHDILYQQDSKTHVDFTEYCQNLCMNFSRFSEEDRQPVFQFDIHPTYFNLGTTMPLGIILTELLTNSLKHGRVSGQRLLIAIQLRQHQGNYSLIYQDNGPGFMDGRLVQRDRGLGSYLLYSMTRQLQGALSTYNQNGARTEINFQEKES